MCSNTYINFNVIFIYVDLLDDPNEKDPAQLEAFELYVKDRIAYRYIYKKKLLKFIFFVIFLVLFFDYMTKKLRSIFYFISFFSLIRARIKEQAAKNVPDC
jgi:hypothetical protein